MILNGSPRGDVNPSSILNQGRSPHKIKYIKLFLALVRGRTWVSLEVL